MRRLCLSRFALLIDRTGDQSYYRATITVTIVFQPLNREFPVDEAREMGLDEGDIATLRAAFKMFDGSYNSLIAVLRQYGVSDDLLRVVFTIAADQMGEARDDVNIFDKDDTMAWTKGQTGTQNEVQKAGRITPTRNLFATVAYWFSAADRERYYRRNR